MMLSKNFNPDDLEKTHKELLEADIIAAIAERLAIDSQSAMRIYYESRLSRQIEKGLHGIQYLDAAYLVEDLFRNESELIA